MAAPMYTDTAHEKFVFFLYHPQWGAADAEIEVPSDENTELTGSPFKAWNSSVYCQACYAYCQGYLPR